jgi:hypothetical protein
MRFSFFCFLFISICCTSLFAQRDSLTGKGNPGLDSINARQSTVPVVDSMELAKENWDQSIADSLAMIYLRPDSLRENQFMSRLWKDSLSNFSSLKNTPAKPRGILKKGQTRRARELWIIAAIIGLLIYTALLNLFLGNDIKSVIQSFYIKQPLSQADKEGGLINSWAFVGLFLLFSLSFGLVLYQLTIYYDRYYGISGFQLFISLSIAVGVLFAFKFLILKFIGFIFDINRLVSQYIAILNLTYFNIAFVLLAVAICFSLLARQLIPLLLNFTLVLIALIFVWQYIRNSVNFISNFRFHKFYLFVYLCALEICPILILIKALNI